MSDISYQSMGPLYYRHSGRLSLAGWILGVTLASLATIPISVGYTYATLYIPWVGRFTFLITFAYAFVINLIISLALKSGKTRNTPMAFLSAMVITTFALATAWYVFVYAFRRHQGDNDITIFKLIANPNFMMAEVRDINANGVRVVKGHTDTGATLTALWICEAATLYVIAIGLSMLAFTRLTFCEKCNKWGVTKELGKLAPGDDKALKSTLERHDFSMLQNLGAPTNPNEWYKLTLEGCPDCDTTQSLTIDKTTITHDKKGNETKKDATVLRRLMLSPEELVLVSLAVAEASASPGTPPPPEPESK